MDEGAVKFGVVIVGAGQAACQAAASLRQLGYAATIMMIGDEEYLPYHRPPLSKGLLQRKMATDALRLRPESFYETLRCEMRLGVRAVAIDRDKHLLHLDNGESVGYEYLVLATGARARPYPALPADPSRIHTLRTIDDAARLSAALAPGSRLAIIGAGYVGMEVAASAVQLGLEVAVFEAAPRLMQRSVGEHTSAAIASFHQRRGVRLHLSSLIDRIEAVDGGALVIRTKEGASCVADTLVIGIGARPNMELAAAAGIECDRAIVVDHQCRTNDPVIFAIGDCTEQSHPLVGARFRMESVQNAIDQAKSAAAAIAGAPPPPVAVPWFWSDQYEHRIQVAGLPLDYDEIVVRAASGQAQPSLAQSVWYLRDCRVIAVETIDSPGDFQAGKMLIKNGARVACERLADPSTSLNSVQIPTTKQA